MDNVGVLHPAFLLLPLAALVAFLLYTSSNNKADLEKFRLEQEKYQRELEHKSSYLKLFLEVVQIILLY